MAAVIAAVRRRRKKGTLAAEEKTRRKAFADGRQQGFSTTNMTVGMLVARFCAKLKLRIQISDEVRIGVYSWPTRCCYGVRVSVGGDTRDRALHAFSVHHPLSVT